MAAANDTDGGSVETAIKAQDGKVVMMYHRPVSLILFDPQNALELAHMMARCSYEARYGKPPIDEGHQLLAQQVRKQITREMRDRLIARVELMQRSLSEQHRNPRYIATELVDTVLSGSA